MADEEPEIMTVSEVARYLKLSEQIIRRLDIPRTKLGRIIRYKKSDVENWLETHKDRRENKA